MPVVFVLVAVGLWWMGHPTALPTSDDVVDVTAKTDQQVYVGVTVKDERDIKITSVEMDTAADSTDSLDSDGLEVRAWICKDGAISQTTQPERFCGDVLPAEGNTLHLGGADQLMLSVDSTTPVELDLERLQIGFRDGLQRGTDPFGPPFAITVLA
ncbi:hypothetical protein ASG90_12335 [Nocardioides sp. Soil797]|nr:hypothetical protein ASG90_12335 [Nocardioides sp. Soil797]